MAANVSVISAKVISREVRPIGFYYRSRTNGRGPRYHMPMATEPTRTRYAVLLFVYVAAFITYLDRVCLSVAAPAIQADLGISQVEFAWVFTVFYIAYSVFEMPTSWLGDRWGQRLMLVRIVGCWSLFTIFTGLARSFTTMLATRT